MNDSAEKNRLFNWLVLEHHLRVRAFVRSLGVGPDWVDDIAQEAFMTAYEKWNTFDQSRDFGKWVRGIAANIVSYEFRKQARRRRILDSGLTDILLNLYHRAEEPIDPVGIDAVKACLGKLSPENREIVQGRYRDNLTAPELAKKHEKSAVNIRQMLVRIRRDLHACVERRLAEESRA